MIRLIARGALVLQLVIAGTVSGAEIFDLVILDGRVIDPESELDAVLNVGIVDDRIEIVTDRPIEGRAALDARGLVVSPGFIDLHVHGFSTEAQRYQVRDGITTALELESGVAEIANWLDSLTGHSIVNFGASADHFWARYGAMSANRAEVSELQQSLNRHGRQSPQFRRWRFDRASRRKTLEPTEYAAMRKQHVRALDAGAVGIGFPVGYHPAVDSREVSELFRFAADREVPVFVHVRMPDGADLLGVQEVLATAMAHGTPLQLVHINSVSRGSIDVALALIAGARERGHDVTAEVYPYTAASTNIATAIFDTGWQDRTGMGYGDLQWQATGERLTEETFNRFRETGGVVIAHMMREDWIEQAISAPEVMIASDGMRYAPLAHPRTAGTFSRVLGRYVRERSLIPLRQALAKMTWLPAQRLETVAPAAARKGRLQAGMDADIVIFDPDTIIDTATYTDGLSYSRGIHHVLVNGEFVVRNGENVPDARPGRPLLGEATSGM